MSLALTLVILSTVLVFASPVTAASNNLWAWGHNTSGQLGYSLILYTTEPAQVSGLSDVVVVASHGGSTFVLKKDGTVWGFGNNTIGQLADGTTTFPAYQFTPCLLYTSDAADE